MTASMGWALAAVALLAILAYDAILVSRKRPSMSRWLIEVCINRPWIPFLAGFGAGFLAGHLYFPLESCVEALR